MKKISIIYHSGVGNTKLVAKIMRNILEEKNICVYLKSVEEKIDIQEIATSSALIFGFPIYHGAPSTSMKLFIKDSNWLLTMNMPYFVYSTYGLYSANATRVFAKLLDKNSNKIFPVYHSGYRMAATDGVLIAPSISFFQTFERNLVSNIKEDILKFISILESKQIENYVRIPRFKLYTILNYPNKKAGEWTKFKIKVNHYTCITCKTCVRICPHKCLLMNTDLKIVFGSSKCENYYRCVHNCPAQSLSIKKRSPKVQLKQRSYREFLENIDV